MEIEIVTTKKKISKSLINQMPIATIGDMEFCLSHGDPIHSHYILGLLIGCRKDCREAILIKKINDYAIIKVAPWLKSLNDDCVWYKAGSASVQKKFKTREMRDRWFELYEKCVKIGRKTHIYI